MVRFIVSVSDALCDNGVGLVLVELLEPPDVIVCDADKRFVPSMAIRASCVSADGAALVGNNWRTAEFANWREKKSDKWALVGDQMMTPVAQHLRLSALWNKLVCRFSDMCVT